MMSSRMVIYMSSKILAGILFSAALATASGQVLPSEVSNPRARAAESRYLPQLESLQQRIGTASFEYPFQLARYVNAKSGRAAMDRDGLEFVNFQHRTILKVSGVYKAAFEAGLQTENVRATRILEGAGLPLLRMAADTVPDSDDYDGIGLEILYGTRDTNSAYYFEGREVLSVVFSREDARAFAKATTNDARQEILNRSDLYVNGKAFGVALGQRDPIDPGSSDPGSSEDRAVRETAQGTDSAVLVRASLALRAASKGDTSVEPAADEMAQLAAKSHETPVMEAKLEPPPTMAAVDTGLARVRVEHDLAPSLEHSGDQVLMHVSLRNSLNFNGANSSIYKRAAQSFDLFLAPELREVLKTVPDNAKFDAFKFSIVNHVANGVTPSETIDYICPVKSTQSFLENKITSQDLINQSTVLVNGMRIGLNLETVE